MKNFFRIVFASCLLMMAGRSAAQTNTTPVLFSMVNLNNGVGNRSILITPDTTQNPLWFGSTLLNTHPFTIQPVNGQVITNLLPWGYTFIVDGWPRSVHVTVPASTNVVNVVTLINTNQFAPLNLSIFPTANGTATNLDQNATNQVVQIVTNLPGKTANYFNPSQTVITNFFPLLPNVIYAFGTSPSAGTFFKSSTIAWTDASNNPQVGGYTNVGATLTMVYDQAFPKEFTVGITPFNVNAATWLFDVSAIYDFTTHSLLPAQNTPWNVNNGTGTFLTTNGIAASTISTTNNYTSGLTNAFDFWAAVFSLPYAPGNLIAGGTVIVPPGITFIGTNALLTHVPFSLGIIGSAGGRSTLVITNGDGSTPGILLGTDSGQSNGATFMSITIKDLTVCYQTDITNAAIELRMPTAIDINNLTVAPFGQYLGGSGQFDGFGYQATNEIGLRFNGFNGQQTVIRNINTSGNHIGIDLMADHVRIDGYDTEADGKSTATNSWATNISSLGCGLRLDSGYEQIISGFHAFNQTVCILNNFPAGGSAHTEFIGGDWGEFSTYRTVTVNPGAGPLVFFNMEAFGNVADNDKMAQLTSTNWNVSITNSISCINFETTNDNGAFAENVNVGGQNSLEITTNGNSSRKIVPRWRYRGV